MQTITGIGAPSKPVKPGDPVTVDPINMSPPIAQLPNIPLPAPVKIQPCESSVANNSKAGANMAKGAAVVGGLTGLAYWAVAIANAEDGIGEVMAGLRLAQIAKVGYGTVAASEIIEVTAGANGMADAGIAFASGGAPGMVAGAGIGVGVTPSVCYGN